MIKKLKNTEVAIKHGQSSETVNIEYTMCGSIYRLIHGHFHIGLVIIPETPILALLIHGMFLGLTVIIRPCLIFVIKVTRNHHNLRTVRFHVLS